MNPNTQDPTNIVADMYTDSDNFKLREMQEFCVNYFGKILHNRRLPGEVYTRAKTLADGTQSIRQIIITCRLDPVILGFISHTQSLAEMRASLIREAFGGAFSRGRRFGFAFGTSNNGGMVIEFLQVPSNGAQPILLGGGPLNYTQENDIENIVVACFQQFRL